MPSVVRMGPYEVRLARNDVEIRAAQALRYRVFVEEMGADAEAACHAARIEIDRFDAFCDHLVVVEADRPVERVLGCYRLLRSEVARRNGGFYSDSAFALGPLRRAGVHSLELGRACVDPSCRKGPAVQLLWRGIAEYLEDHGVDVMFGCASLPGTDLDTWGPLLRWLHERHRAPAAMRPRALPARRAKLPRGPSLDDAAALRVLPPLLRGYLGLGAGIGDGAVIDPEFGTIDVCVVLPTERVAARYRRKAAREAASDAVDARPVAA